jgi:predicted nucleic acid-binding Zn ribbon protein
MNRYSSSSSQGKLRPIGGTIDKVIRSLGIAKDYYGWLVVSRWPEIVGKDISRHAKAVRFQDGILFVAVPDAAWRQNLSMETQRIVDKIRSLPYGKSIERLRLVRGEKGL